MFLLSKGFDLSMLMIFCWVFDLMKLQRILLEGYKVVGSMSRGKENAIEEEERKSLCVCDYSMRNRRGVADGDSGNGCWASSSSPPPEKIRACETERRFDPSRTGEGRVGSCSYAVDTQDADYSDVPSLNYEVEGLILARVPRSEYWKFCFVNKRYLTLLKSGELFRIRRDNGVEESSVFMLASGETSWWAFDRQFKSRRMLPILPSDPCFSSADKESVCAGTHLIVSGREFDGVVIWRYELAMNKWFKGPNMLNPRCMFASANCGNFACVAGGISMGTTKEVLNSAEIYNPDSKSWDPLPRMNKRRKHCSGCYMDNKFYVIGGQNEKGEGLTCGEAYDGSRRTWDLIPDMLKDAPVSTSQSPPLVAVVNNDLYSLEASSNELKVYLKETNSWRRLGTVPVRADFNRGWGVAFKSLGNELLVIGASSVSFAGHGMTIYTCCPHPDAEELLWKPLDNGRNRLSHFILNCSVMIA